MLMLLINLIQVLANLYSIILLVRVLSSWLNADPYNPIVQFVYRFTDPFIRFIARVIPTRFGMIDFSPMIAMIIVWLGANVLIRLLLRLV